MVEAVVAIPFLLIMFAAIVYVNRLYETKLNVMRFTREAAWDYAMCNCGESGDGITQSCITPEAATGSVGSTSSGAPDGYDSTKISSIGSFPGGSVAGTDFGSSKSTLSSDLTADTMMGGFKQTLSSNTVVMCNEAPHDASLTGFGAAAMDAWKKW